VVVPTAKKALTVDAALHIHFASPVHSWGMNHTEKDGIADLRQEIDVSMKSSSSFWPNASAWLKRSLR
jgi:hypothetical protein